MKNELGESLLHISVKEDFIELVEYLLVKGVVVNVQNNEGETPLHYAIRNDCLEMIRLLLDWQADIAILNKKNETPVDIASNEVKKIFNLENLLMLKRWGNKYNNTLSK